MMHILNKLRTEIWYYRKRLANWLFRFTPEKTQERHLLLEFRNHLFFFGVDLYGMTDDELLEHVKEANEILGRAMREFGMSMEDATNAFAMVKDGN